MHSLLEVENTGIKSEKFIINDGLDDYSLFYPISFQSNFVRG